MGINLRWVGETEQDRVAETRLNCYAHASNQLTKYKDGIRTDPRADSETAPGDFLLAEQDGLAVGTSTHLSLKLWMRGACLDCQGVAYVGTVKTARRSGGAKGTGVASQMMHEMIRRARERGDALTTLMPFRGSFYEHFGYGLVEHRNTWTIPLGLLPSGATDGIRFYSPSDQVELTRFRNLIAARGQCDIERPAGLWPAVHKKAEEGFEIIDRPDPSGPARGYLWYTHFQDKTQDILKVMDCFYEDVAALKRQLHFLSSLRDQYAAAILTLPVDMPLAWLLKETQLPHRPVNHATAKVETINRLQLRVLDHRKTLEALDLPVIAAGKVNVAVQECEGPITHLRIEISGGRATVKSGGAGDHGIALPDKVWAAIVCGDLPATQAMQIGLAQGDAKSAAVLDCLTVGPRPFCGEAF